MGHRRAGAIGLIGFVLGGLLAMAPPVRAAEYELETAATYAVDPEAGEIAVSVDLDFTNTTPDPEGRFSVFEEVRLAVHDQARDVTATDEDGELDVDVDVDDGVNVATVELREALRFEESTSFELSYTLPDTDEPHLRVRPSVVVFPAWGFGTSSEVSVTVPDGYEVRVDGDELREEGDAYVSGEIADPSQWLALVTALRPTEYATLETTVPLSGGTADLTVRAFADDESWGTRMRDLLVEALPLMEAELGLPYPLVGGLVVTQAVPADTTGFGESAAGGTEILVAYDQPDFTAVHQLAHVWLSAAFADARWIREGLASVAASRVADELDLDPPYDPAEVVEQQADAAMPLDAWTEASEPASETWGYAASWDLMNRIDEQVGPEAIRTVLRRVAAGIGPYQAASMEPEPSADGVMAPSTPLGSRSFLDQLQTVSGENLGSLFADRVLGAEDAALLEDRAAARDAFDDLAAAGGTWGTPDPVNAAMAAWSFDEAMRHIADATDWLNGRDALMERMRDVGLSPSERLQQAYRAFGGGADADQELEAHAAVVELYAEAADAVNAERSFIERVGLLAGPDPAAELAAANGHFAAGELREAVDAIGEARRLVDAAATSGIVRLASAALVVILLLVVAVLLFRRRASYTQQQP